MPLKNSRWYIECSHIGDGHPRGIRGCPSPLNPPFQYIDIAELAKGVQLHALADERG
jgi:hypothetical protein